MLLRSCSFLRGRSRPPHDLTDAEEQEEWRPTSVPAALLCSTASQIPIAGVKGVNLISVVKAVRVLSPVERE